MPLSGFVDGEGLCLEPSKPWAHALQAAGGLAGMSATRREQIGPIIEAMKALGHRF